MRIRWSETWDSCFHHTKEIGGIEGRRLVESMKGPDEGAKGVNPIFVRNPMIRYAYDLMTFR